MNSVSEGPDGEKVKQIKYRKQRLRCLGRKGAETWWYWWNVFTVYFRIAYGLVKRGQTSIRTMAHGVRRIPGTLQNQWEVYFPREISRRDKVLGYRSTLRYSLYSPSGAWSSPFASHRIASNRTRSSFRPDPPLSKLFGSLLPYLHTDSCVYSTPPRGWLFSRNFPFFFYRFPFETADGAGVASEFSGT